MRDQPVLTKR
jgi:hypothetical protein